MSGRVRVPACPVYEDGVYWVGVGRRQGRKGRIGGRVEDEGRTVARVGDEGREGCFSHSLLTTSSVQ